jgi:hypothetical protein
MRLAVGKPPQARANDELDLGACTNGERRALQSSLASSDDDHVPPAIGLIVLERGRERHTVSDGLSERRRRIRERDRPDSHHHLAHIELVPRSGGQPIAVRGPLEGCHIRRVTFWDEGLPEPLGVAQELLERNWLLTLLAHHPCPAVDAAEVAGGGERGLLPVRAKEHVRRHPRAPRLHRLAERAHTSPGQMRRDGEPVRACPDDRDVETLRQSDRRRARPRVEAPKWKRKPT